MSLFVAQELTSRLAKLMHGGFTELCVSWEERCEEDDEFPRAPAESTLRRWLLHGMPSRKSSSNGAGFEYFGLSALLNVDPLILFDFERNGYFSKFTTMRKMLFAGFGFPSSLAPMIEMYGPEEQWPNQRLAQKFFKTEWQGEEFSNVDDWQNKHYACVRLLVGKDRYSMPNAAHVAYRRVKSPDSLWRYYGSVIRIDNQMHLYSESGDHQCITVAEDQSLAFRTFYGGRPVEWRVASLFPFSCEVEVPSDNDHLLTFRW